jgi:predicted dehydrogenase
MDAVVLANYANEHVPFGIRLMESGRHIMTECLTCSTMKEAVELIEAVERTGVTYTYAENYCYTPVRWEMRQRYRRGDIGELMYAEGEYLHDCSSIWPQITYGERNHWRNLMPSTFYCTHSIGPILYMTGLRPVQVTGYETPNMPFMRKLGNSAGTLGMEVITLENGAFMKSLHFGIKHYRGSNYQLNGDLGALQDMGDGTIGVYMEEGPGRNGQGKRENYKPSPIVAGTENSGHGGADYFTTHYFVRSILGDPEARERAINVYDAVDMCIPGTLAYISIAEGNKPIKIPNLRNKEGETALLFHLHHPDSIGGGNMDANGHFMTWIGSQQNVPVIKALIEKGADVNKPDAEGERPLQAVSENEREVRALLINAGAK